MILHLILIFLGYEIYLLGISGFFAGIVYFFKEKEIALGIILLLISLVIVLGGFFFWTKVIFSN